MNQSTAKTIRNILANELGITREAVRQMIEERVDKLFERESMKKLVEQAVDTALTGAMRESRWDRTTLRESVKNAAREAVANRMVLTVELKAAS